MVGGGDGSPDCDLVTHAATGAAVMASSVTAFIAREGALVLVRFVVWAAPTRLSFCG